MIVAEKLNDAGPMTTTVDATSTGIIPSGLFLRVGATQ